MYHCQKIQAILSKPILVWDKTRQTIFFDSAKDTSYRHFSIEWNTCYFVNTQKLKEHFNIQQAFLIFYLYKCRLPSLNLTTKQSTPFSLLRSIHTWGKRAGVYLKEFIEVFNSFLLQINTDLLAIKGHNKHIINLLLLHGPSEPSNRSLQKGYGK